MVALDRARAGETDQVPHRAGLVVRAGCASTTEGLRADDRARGLVVHIEVACRVSQRLVGLSDRRLVAGEDSAGQSVGRRLVDGLESVGPVDVVVYVGGEDRREQLLGDER